MGLMPQTIIETQLTPSIFGFTVFTNGEFGFRCFILDRILLRGRFVVILVCVPLSLPEFLGLVGEVTVLGFSSSCHNAQFPLQLLDDLVLSFTLFLEFSVLLLVVVNVSPMYQELVQSSLLFEGLVSFREFVQRNIGEGSHKGVVIHLLHNLPDLWILGVETLSV